jgi:hypothetical protein
MLFKKIIFSLLLISASYSASGATTIPALPDMRALSLDSNALSNKDLLDWVSQVIISAYSSEQDPEKLKAYFTESGYARILNTLGPVDKNIKSEAKLSPGRNAAVVVRDITNNILSWRILIPITVKQDNTEKNLMITVFLSRVDDPKIGLKITGFHAKNS